MSWKSVAVSWVSVLVSASGSLVLHGQGRRACSLQMQNDGITAACCARKRPLIQHLTTMKYDSPGCASTVSWN